MIVDCFPSADVYCDVILTSLWRHNTNITFYLYVIFLHSFYIVWWGSNCRNASWLSMLFCQFSVVFSCKYLHILNSNNNKSHFSKLGHFLFVDFQAFCTVHIYVHKRLYMSIWRVPTKNNEKSVSWRLYFFKFSLQSGRNPDMAFGIKFVIYIKF